MELKEAYKTALKEKVQPLVDSGKITLLGTLEDLVADIADAFFDGLELGAQYSKTPIDDVIVPPAVKILRGYVNPLIDKIDGEENR